MITSVVLVLGFNLLQLLVLYTYVDMTYISLIAVSSVLYWVIYKRDMIFNLRVSGRGQILSNMREMYILADREKRIVDISPLLIDKYNIDEEQIIGKKFSELQELLSDRVVLYSEYNMKDESNKNKEHFHVREKEFKIEGLKDFGYMILLFDETKVYNLLRELNRLSNYDSMTGLNNRNYIEIILSNISDVTSIGVISLDLNGLKINNDYLGHERGDYLLKALANTLKEVFHDTPEKDIARIGGDEFLVLVYSTTAEYIEEKKNEILRKCNHELIEKTISVSIGTAYGIDVNQSIFRLIQDADESMYKMKSENSKLYKKAFIDYIKMQDKFIR